MRLLDNIAPVINEVVINNDGYGITGQTDSKAIIQVMDADGNLRAESQSDELGYFSTNIYPPYYVESNYLSRQRI